MSENNGHLDGEIAAAVKERMDGLSQHLESVGIDGAKQAMGAIFESLFVVGRLHPDQNTRTVCGALALQLWDGMGTAQALLNEVGDEDDAPVH